MTKARPFIASTCLLVASTVVAVHFTHSETFSDFDTYTDAGWATTETSSEVWWPDGNFLGPFDSAANAWTSLGILDPLPTGDGKEYGDRRVVVEFDLILTESLVVLDPFTVVANGVTIVSETYIGGIDAVHIESSFALDESENGIGIDFTGTGIGSFGLDNVLVDWSASLCEGDVDGSNSVEVNDLLIVIGQWGPCDDTCLADLDDSGDVGVDDLLILLGHWRACG